MEASGAAEDEANQPDVEAQEEAPADHRAAYAGRRAAGLLPIARRGDGEAQQNPVAPTYASPPGVAAPIPPVAEAAAARVPRQPDFGCPEDARDTNQRFWHQFVNVDGQQAKLGTYEKRQGLADCHNGKVERHRVTLQDGSEVSVVVKKMKTPMIRSILKRPESDRYASCGVEDPWTEIGVMKYLEGQQPCQYVLRMHEYFIDADHTCLVTEDCRGGELFALLTSDDMRGKPMSQETVQKVMNQLLKGTAYLHEHRIGHRDISLENILVHTDPIVPLPLGAVSEVFLKNPQIRLMDFGQAVVSKTSDNRPYRFFSFVGKPFYRPPEMYIGRDCVENPHIQVHCELAGEQAVGDIVQVSHQDGHIEVRLGMEADDERRHAEVMGYRAEPFDAFSCGVAFFIFNWRMPPWNSATRQCQIFRHVQNVGLSRLLQGWNKSLLPPLAMTCLESLVHVNPEQRWTCAHALKNPWIAAGSAAVAASPATSPTAGAAATWAAPRASPGAASSAGGTGTVAAGISHWEGKRAVSAGNQAYR